MSCAVERIGLALFAKPADGLFVWERLGHIVDSLALEQASERAGIMLAPARSHLGRSPWLPFNVAVRQDTRDQRWLRHQAADKAA
jgi:hypothetical protein